MMTLEELISRCRSVRFAVPQPEGKEVATAHESGLLPDSSTMLHVIAVLLAECRAAVRLLEVSHDTRPQ